MARYASGLGTVLHLAGVSQPAATNVLNETAIDFLGCAPALGPVQNELGTH